MRSGEGLAPDLHGPTHTHFAYHGQIGVLIGASIFLLCPPTSMTIQHLKLPDKLPSHFGFRSGKKGVHNSRTISFDDLSTLLAHVSADATNEEYRAAIREENVLGKNTASTRRYIGQRLSQLYGLDHQITVFRVFRMYWGLADAGRPLLALLLALARDPILRLTAPIIIDLDRGEAFDKKVLQASLRTATGDRFNETSIEKIARMSASSWTQAGHLEGRYTKHRRPPDSTPATVAYALLLGYLSGRRSSMLFDTFWTRVLDVEEYELHELAREASRRGLLTYRNAAGVIEVDFSGILTNEDVKYIHEQG